MTDIYSTTNAPAPSESTIAAFFRGEVDATMLDREWSGAFDESRDAAGAVVSRQLRTSKGTQEFAVTSAHCVRLVDAVLQSELSHEALDAVCFAVESSDGFTWDADAADGERIARALFLLGTPEVNYPLCDRVLRKVRHYLATGEDQLTAADLKA